jgi:hypothetical protein
MAEEKEGKEKKEIVCRADGTFCNICGGPFPDGDEETVCINGHEVGEVYSVPNFNLPRET